MVDPRAMTAAISKSMPHSELTSKDRGRGVS